MARFPSYWLNNTPVLCVYHIFFIHSFVDGHLGWREFLCRCSAGRSCNVVSIHWLETRREPPASAKGGAGVAAAGGWRGSELRPHGQHRGIPASSGKQVCFLFRLGTCYLTRRLSKCQAPDSCNPSCTTVVNPADCRGPLPPLGLYFRLCRSALILYSLPGIFIWSERRRRTLVCAGFAILTPRISLTDVNCLASWDRTGSGK